MTSYLASAKRICGLFAVLVLCMFGFLLVASLPSSFRLGPGYKSGSVPIDVAIPLGIFAAIQNDAPSIAAECWEKIMTDKKLMIDKIWPPGHLRLEYVPQQVSADNTAVTLRWSLSYSKLNDSEYGALFRLQEGFAELYKYEAMIRARAAWKQGYSVPSVSGDTSKASVQPGGE